MLWPRTLFGRSLLIVVIPLLLLQLVLSYMFYNRHWDTVTRWLASGVAGEVALLVEMLDRAPDALDRVRTDQVQRHTALDIWFEPDVGLQQAITAAGVDEERIGHIDSKILE